MTISKYHSRKQKSNSRRRRCVQLAGNLGDKLLHRNHQLRPHPGLLSVLRDQNLRVEPILRRCDADTELKQPTMEEKRIVRSCVAD